MCKDVTNILARETGRLAEAFTGTGDGVIITDPGGCVVFMNEAAQNLTEYSFTEAKGIHINKLLTLTDPHTETPCSLPIEEAVQTGQKIGIKEDTVMITKSGLRYDIIARCSPVFYPENELAGAVLHFRDITDSKKLKEELISNQNNFRIIFDTAPDGMILVDTDSKIKEINKAWQETMCIDELTMLGQRFGDGFRCIESLMNGCGRGQNCMVCKIRNNIVKVLETGLPNFNIIFRHEFVLNEKNFSPLLKTSFYPMIFQGEQCVLISADDISEASSI